MNVYLAEFIGTALMILLGNGVVANVVLKGFNSSSSKKRQNPLLITTVSQFSES